jgi:hypothetical protein
MTTATHCQYVLSVIELRHTLDSGKVELEDLISRISK